MRALRQIKLTVTTDASGDGTANSSEHVLGWLYSIIWVLGTFDAGVDGVVSCQIPNTPALAYNVATLTNANANKVYYPRTLEHLDTAGTDLTTHTHPLLDGHLRLTVAQGGNAKTGSAVVYYFIE